jgi:hypothetical protein
MGPVLLTMSAEIDDEVKDEPEFDGDEVEPEIAAAVGF